MSRFEKDAYGYYTSKPVADVDSYAIDWTMPLNGELIDSSSWEISGVVASAEGVSSDHRRAIVMLSGGSYGGHGLARNSITTTGGRVLSQSFRIYGCPQ